MKRSPPRNTAYGVLAGILLAMLAILVVVRAFFPNDVALFEILASVVVVFLFLYAYRVTGKKADAHVSQDVSRLIFHLTGC